MSSWKVCAAALRLRSQIDAEFPGRDTRGDGTIGDASHASRKSDHNPDANGYVCAIDFTHDPAKFDSYKFADRLAALKDPRISGIGSWNVATRSERWWDPSRGWRDADLGGASHQFHLHVSFVHDDRAYLGDQPFNLGGGVVPAPVPIVEDDVAYKYIECDEPGPNNGLFLSGSNGQLAAFASPTVRDTFRKFHPEVPWPPAKATSAEVGALKSLSSTVHASA